MPVPTFTVLPPKPEFNDIVKKVNVIVQELTNLILNLDSLNVVSLTADHIDTGTLDAGVVTIRGEDGSVFYQIDSTGIVANNGTIDTLKFDLATGLLTVISMLIKSSNSNERVAIDSTGFHSYDPSGVERITIGTAPAKGAKAIVGRDTSGTAQSVYTYDTENVDGTDRIGQYVTAHGAYFLLSDDGDVRIQNSVGAGFRAVSGTPEVNDGFGWSTIATTGLAGTKIYYVSDSSGGAVTRKLTFTDGILTSET